MRFFQNAILRDHLSLLLTSPWWTSLHLWLGFGAGAAVSATILMTPLSPTTAASSSCGEPPSVTLDVGHTLNRPGAISARGKTEYEFNRTLALELAPALRVIGFEVRILNEEGREISLAERSSRLGAIGQGVILSLHHDSVQPRYMERSIVGGKAMGYSRHAEGFSLFVSGRSAAFEASKELAHSIGSELRKADFAPSMHHAEAIKGEWRPIMDAPRGIFRFDGLSVLKSARVPAVLFEAGVIVNPEEERDIESPVWQERLVRAVARGITAYCRLSLID